MAHKAVHPHFNLSHGKQFTLFTHRGGGPNGWKVAVMLEELGLTYESRYLDFGKQEHKAESHTKYNPNGRIPTLIDHQANDFAVWESNAIIVYLVELYDKEHKISADKPGEKIRQLQWLFFQASGQGPYFGQAGWFNYHHPEKVPSAVERYKNEIRRVLGVLNSVLSKREWLVGDKCTVADLSFIPWNQWMIDRLMAGELNLNKDYPAVHSWHSRLLERDSVKKVNEIRASLL